MVPCEVEYDLTKSDLIVHVPMKYVQDKVGQVQGMVYKPGHDIEIVLRPDMKNLRLFGKRVRVIGNHSGS